MQNLSKERTGIWVIYTYNSSHIFRGKIGMSNYSDLKSVLEKMKAIGMKPPQIRILGDFLLSIASLGVDECRDVLPDLVDKIFGEEEIKTDPGEIEPAEIEKPIAATGWQYQRHPEKFKPPTDECLLKPEIPPGMKTCHGPCHRVLPFSEFSKNKVAKDGLQHWCRKCFSDRRKDKMDENIDSTIDGIMGLPLPAFFNKTDIWTNLRIAEVTGVSELRVNRALQTLVSKRILARMMVKQLHTNAYWRPNGAGKINNVVSVELPA